MQAKAPEPLPQKKRRPTVAVTNVPQEAFAPIGQKLAEALGWKGEDHFVGNGLTVRDARRYITKLLHDAHQAGAHGKPSPDVRPPVDPENPRDLRIGANVYETLSMLEEASLHLSVDNPEEQAALSAALSAAYATGKDAVKKEVAVRRVSMDTDMEGSADAILGKFAAHEAALKEGK